MIVLFHLNQTLRFIWSVLSSLFFTEFIPRLSQHSLVLGSCACCANFFFCSTTSSSPWLIWSGAHSFTVGGLSLPLQWEAVIHHALQIEQSHTSPVPPTHTQVRTRIIKHALCTPPRHLDKQPPPSTKSALWVMILPPSNSTHHDRWCHNLNSCLLCVQVSLFLFYFSFIVKILFKTHNYLLIIKENFIFLFCFVELWIN